VLEHVRAQPHSLLEAGKIRFNGEEVGEFAFKKIAPDYPYAIWMPQPVFLAYPRLGHGPIPHEELRGVQRLREDDVRTLHRLQLGAQRVLLGQTSRNPIVRWLTPRVLRPVLRSPLLPGVQRRLFFGAPLPPLDPAFSFRDGGAQARLDSSSAQRA